MGQRNWVRGPPGIGTILQGLVEQLSHRSVVLWSLSVYYLVIPLRPITLVRSITKRSELPRPGLCA